MSAGFFLCQRNVSGFFRRFFPMSADFFLCQRNVSVLFLQKLWRASGIYAKIITSRIRLTHRLLRFVYRLQPFNTD